MSKVDWTVRRLSSCDSTMDEAVRLMPQLSPGSFAVVLADAQTRGRGRQGNRWNQSTVGLYATFILPRAAEAERYQGLSLALGVLVAEVLKGEGCRVFLKWPNDILNGDSKKLAGSLVELRDAWISWGLGINILGEPSGSAALVRGVETPAAFKVRDGLVAILCERLPEFWHVYESHGFSAFREAWRRHAFGLGQHVVLRATPEVHVQGVAIDIETDGSLLIHDTVTNNKTKVLSGHVERWGTYTNAACD